MTQPVTWNPQEYAQNSASQLAWATELMARFTFRGDEHVLDVGCGDGKITALLAKAVPRGQVLGVDASREMIAHARAHHTGAAQPNLAFREMDARRLQVPPAGFDLVFSNAALHWVDDHPAFLHGAAAALRPGGRLAVSCGGRGNAAEVFLALKNVLRRVAWRPYFRRMEPAYFFHAPDEYQRWLRTAGFQPSRVQLSEKFAAHPGADGLAAWFRTTWLPYTQRVPAAQREQFVAEVVERYLARFPLDADGNAQVRMVRLEIESQRLAA